MSTDDLADELLRAAARLSRWATRHSDLELPWAQARVLSLVEELGPARITALAAIDDTAQPTMTAQVQRLEARGWVERTPDPADARATHVALTGAGAEVLAQARAARAAALAPVLDRLGADPERLRAATALLADLVEATREQAPVDAS